MSVYSIIKIHMSINTKGFRVTETCHKVKKEHPGNYAVFENSTGSGRDTPDSKVMCIEKDQIGVVRRQAQYHNYVSCFMYIINDNSTDADVARKQVKAELGQMLREVNDDVNMMNITFNQLN